MSEDLVGKKFDRLTVIEDVGKIIVDNSNIKRSCVKCKCDCGKEVIVKKTLLTHNKVKSCGCLKRELMSNVGKKHKKQNDFYVINDIVHVILNNSGKEVLCDINDWEKLNKYCWFENKCGYAETNIGNKMFKMTRLIMNPDNDKVVDHINGNTLDNRKSNLRVVTQSENNMNKRIQSNNISGITGVYFDTYSSKWRAAITVRGKKFDLGRYNDINDAAKARKEAEIKYFGEYRYGGIA